MWQERLLRSSHIVVQICDRRLRSGSRWPLGRPDKHAVAIVRTVRNDCVRRAPPRCITAMWRNMLLYGLALCLCRCVSAHDTLLGGDSVAFSLCLLLLPLVLLLLLLFISLAGRLVGRAVSRSSCALLRFDSMTSICESAPPFIEGIT